MLKSNVCYSTWKHIEDSLNVGSRQHKVIQTGTEVVLSSLLPEIKISFLFHLMEAEGQFIVLFFYGMPLQ